jgi:hypothetical protein
MDKYFLGLEYLVFFLFFFFSLVTTSVASAASVGYFTIVLFRPLRKIFFAPSLYAESVVYNEMIA